MMPQDLMEQQEKASDCKAFARLILLDIKTVKESLAGATTYD
jgi:hypothetical protein